MTPGPVGMASTPIGTIFLYEMAAGDLQEYSRQPYEDARDRVRWLLSRVASRSSTGNGNGDDRPAMLTREETAALADADVESLVEVFLTSPANQWHSRKAQDAGTLAFRGEDESAVAYLDRLVGWRATLPAEAAPRRDAFVPFASEAPRPQAADAGTSSVLGWVSAGLAISVLLSTAALAFAAMSYFEGKADHQANEAWRADMLRMQQEAKPAGSDKLVAELSAENARLRYRLELVDAKVRSPVRPSAPRPAPKPQPARSGRQAAR
ncbi:MAG TPA: hypothetical protein VM122_04760 [Usitatibacter sp.]|nr:hypothetical protein [Usitatibacter sp.]